MLFDSLKNIRRYEALHEALSGAFDFLEKNDLPSFKEGRYEIVGDSVFALVQEYETVSSETKLLEAHRKYMDIQITVSGSEEMGFAYPEQADEIQPYDEPGDVALYKAETFQTCRIEEGQFAIFLPGELHMPGCSPGKAGPVRVKKIVLKVKI